MKQFQQLRGAGPLRSDVTARHTVCSLSQRPLCQPMYDYGTSKSLTEALPGEVPRDIVTIFEFSSSSNRKLASVVKLDQDGPLLPAVLSHVFQ